MVTDYFLEDINYLSYFSVTNIKLLKFTKMFNTFTSYTHKKKSDWGVMYDFSLKSQFLYNKTEVIKSEILGIKYIDSFLS